MNTAVVEKIRGSAEALSAELALVVSLASVHAPVHDQ